MACSGSLLGDPSGVRRAWPVPGLVRAFGVAAVRRGPGPFGTAHLVVVTQFGLRIVYGSRTQCGGRDLRFGPLAVMRQDRVLCQFDFCTSP
jgi:hypothetical protein